MDSRMYNAAINAPWWRQVVETFYTEEQIAAMLDVKLTRVTRWVRKGYLKHGDGTKHETRISKGQLMLFLTYYWDDDNTAVLQYLRDQEEPLVAVDCESPPSGTPDQQPDRVKE